MKSYKLFLAIFLGLASSHAISAIIDLGDYQYDEATNLQWLDLSLTAGMSVNQSLDVYGSDGWSLASEGQFHDMYNKYDVGGDGYVYGLNWNYVNRSDIA